MLFIFQGEIFSFSSISRDYTSLQAPYQISSDFSGDLGIFFIILNLLNSANLDRTSIRRAGRPFGTFRTSAARDLSNEQMSSKIISNHHNSPFVVRVFSESATFIFPAKSRRSRNFLSVGAAQR
jgi:hypothetical protein